MGRTILPDPTPAPVAPSAPVTTVATPEAQAGAVPPAPAAAEGVTAVAAGVEGATGAAAAPTVVETAEQVAKGERGRKAAEAAMANAKRHREGLARAAQQNQETQRLREENARLQASTRAWEELQQLSQTDKIAAAKRLGFTPGEIARAAIAEGTPEHSAKALREEIAREFEEKYGKRLTDQQAVIDGWTNQQRAAAQAQAEKAVTSAAGDATKYPNLADLSPTFVLELARAVVAQTPPEQRALITNDDLLHFLESQQAEHRKGRASTSPAASPTVATPNGQAGSPQPRTQTNGAKGTPAALVTPEGWDEWSDGKQKRWMSEHLSKSLPQPAARQVATK